MEYKKKVFALSCAVVILSLVYAATLVFDPARRGARADVYTWLDPRATDGIARIVFTLPAAYLPPGAPETVVLSRNGSAWYVLRRGGRYPARRQRVEDFLAELTTRAPFPVISTNAAAHERLALTPDDAARVTVSGVMGPPLLDMLLGHNDPSGRNVYLRRADRNEARSGRDRFSDFVWGERRSWYNLSLFPGSDEGIVPDVTSLAMFPPAAGGETGPLVFTRVPGPWEAVWNVNFDLEAVNQARVNAFVRDVLMSVGEDFADARAAPDAAFDDSRLVLELAGGGTVAIGFTAPDGDERRLASVSGTDIVYVVSGWMHRRLFPAAGTFGL